MSAPAGKDADPRHELNGRNHVVEQAVVQSRDIQAAGKMRGEEKRKETVQELNAFQSTLNAMHEKMSEKMAHALDQVKSLNMDFRGTVSSDGHFANREAPSYTAQSQSASATLGVNDWNSMTNNFWGYQQANNITGPAPGKSDPSVTDNTKGPQQQTPGANDPSAIDKLKGDLYARLAADGERHLKLSRAIAEDLTAGNVDLPMLNKLSNLLQSIDTGDAKGYVSNFQPHHGLSNIAAAPQADGIQRG